MLHEVGLHGTGLRVGDRLYLLYGAANRILRSSTPRRPSTSLATRLRARTLGAEIRDHSATEVLALFEFVEYR